jgi:hypothetical protein
MIYKIGDIVKVHYWSKWVNGEVVKIQDHYQSGKIITVDFEGVVDTYQDFILDQIQEKYIEQLKTKCEKEYNQFQSSLDEIQEATTTLEEKIEAIEAL